MILKNNTGLPSVIPKSRSPDVTVNPVKRRRKKKYSFALARSKERLARFLEKKSTGKPDLASPEDKKISAVPCERDSCAKELENKSDCTSQWC